MKANEFVNKFGWEEAKKVIYLQGSPIYELIWDIKNKKFKNDNGFATLLCETNDNFVFVPYLKRLVESHELVGRYGTADEAKEYLPMLRMDSYGELKQAILDVESCQ